MLKSVIKGAVALSVCVSSLSAFAGGDIGNGGGAIVCRDSAGEVQQAWLLDLWEAENLPIASNGLQSLRIVRDEAQDVERQIFFALRKLELFDPVLSDRIRPRIAQVRALMRTLPIQMRRIEDSNDFATPRIPGVNCQREQLANFTDSYGLIVSQDIYEKLSKTDQAALVLHEVIYKLDREQRGDQVSSDVTRIIVGYLFSDSALKREIFTDQMLLRCKTLEIRTEIFDFSGKKFFQSYSIHADVRFSDWLPWNPAEDEIQPSGVHSHVVEVCRKSPSDPITLDATLVLEGLTGQGFMFRRQASRRSFEVDGLTTLIRERSEDVLGRLSHHVEVPTGARCWRRGEIGSVCEFHSRRFLSIPFGADWDRLP